MSKHTRKKSRHRRKKAHAAPPGRANGRAAARAQGDELTFSPKDLMRLYLRRDWDGLCESFLVMLAHLRDRPMLEMSPRDQHVVDVLVESLLYFMTKPDFVIPERYARPLLSMQPVVANVVALSRFRTTDAQVRMLMDSPGGLLKLLILHNARNTVRIDRTGLFDVDPDFASAWYAYYFYSTDSVASPTTYRNLREHIEAVDERFRLVGQPIEDPFFKSTYVHMAAEPGVRGVINRAVRAAQRGVTIRNRPNRRRIAVVCGRWIPNTSVYRSIQPFVATLFDDYDLTLIHHGRERPSDASPAMDTHGFTDVREVSFRDGVLDVSAVADNDFQLVYFVDVGLSRESIYLANLRLAPIQVTGYGHPVSSFGAEIDYFIGGADVELAADAETNYSERLVLIPGLGCHPVCPVYQPRHPARNDDAIVVNCPWTPMKPNYPLLLVLRDVTRRAGRRVVFQFLPGSAAMRRNAFIPFCRDLEAVLGQDHLRILPHCPRDEYMAALEAGDLSADSYPFGGYNTIVDSLYLGKPVVAREGGKFYNRAAARLLKNFDLDELVAATAEQYAEILLKLVRDEAYRTDLTGRIRGIDLAERLFDPRDTVYFKKAVDFLIDHHDRLRAEGGKSPIFIR